MKILFLGDASNYHVTLAKALADMGHTAVVASSGSSFMHTRRDIDISRPIPGKLGGALLWLKLNTLLHNKLKGFDVVQISNPVFVNLKPHRVMSVFNRLRNNNGSVFLTALGTDTAFVSECMAPDSPLKYNEWRIGSEPGPQALTHPEIAAAWLGEPLASHCRGIYDNVNGIITALYEYHLAAHRMASDEKIAYAGIPVDVPGSAELPPLAPDGKVRILMGYQSHRLQEKGTDRLIEMCRSIEQEVPEKVEVDYVQNVPLSEFRRHLDAAQIVVDQLYSYTPATSALMAMAQGKVAVSGGEADFYDFIGENSLRPIINANPTDLEDTRRAIIELVNNPERLAALGRDSREFVLKHNAANVVAQRFIDFWERRMR